MWTRSRRYLLVVLLAAGCLSSAVRASETDEAAVRQAATQFYAALNTIFIGDAAPMEAVWSHADDVTYMGPGGGMQVGWDAIRAGWQSTAKMKLGGAIEPTDVHVTVASDLAVMQNYEKGRNTNAGGGAQAVSIRVTNVFRREGGQWKMIGHHTDLLPWLAQ